MGPEPTAGHCGLEGPREGPGDWLQLGKLAVSFPVAACALPCRAVATAWVSESASAVFRCQRGLLAAQ